MKKLTMILLLKKRNTDNLEEVPEEKHKEVDDDITPEENKIQTFLKRSHKKNTKKLMIILLWKKRKY